MAKIYFVVLFLLLFLNFSFAQEKSIEGYLVKNSNDTVRGYFYNGKENWKVKTVSFSESISDTPKEYELASFRSLHLKPYNEYYFSRYVQIDKKPIKMGQLESGPARKVETEHILLKLLASGRINLYSYEDENDKKHFFIEKNDKTEELGLVKYMSSNGVIGELPFYIETLKASTSDCDKVTIRMPKLEEQSLIAIIGRYNSCFSDKQYVKEKDKLKFSFGLVLGVKASSLKYAGTDYTVNNAYSYPGASSGKYNVAVNPMGGLYVELSPRKLSSRFAVGLDLIWQQSGSFSAKLERTNVYYREYKTDYTYLSNNLNFKFSFVKKENFNFYAKVGIGVDYLMSYTAQGHTNDIIIMKNVTREFMTFRATGLSYSGGIGISGKRLLAELRYQHDSIYGDQTSTSSLTGGAFLVGCRLNR